MSKSIKVLADDMEVLRGVLHAGIAYVGRLKLRVLPDGKTLAETAWVILDDDPHDERRRWRLGSTLAVVLLVLAGVVMWGMR